MTRGMMWTGLLATLLIAVALGTAALREPNRQLDAAAALRDIAVTEGTDLYAEHCAVCHGAAGEGIGATPALNNEGVAAMDYETIFRTIERGRYNTAMAAYGVEEGGVFHDAEIDSLIAVIQHANWTTVMARVDELGLTPPEIVVAEVSEETLATVASLPDGDALTSGLTLYAANCAACHGAAGEGTTLAPALDSDDLRARLTDADLERLIIQGVPGTLMAAWGGALETGEVADLVTLLRRWDELDAAGVALPQLAAAPAAIDMSPETIAQGEWLYGVLCAQCHGSAGYGTPLAPALNSQTFLAETPDAAIQQIIALGVTGTTMPAWGGRLTDADIAALTAYLRSWEPTAPAIAEPSVGAGSAPGGGGPPWRN